jgi:hypothetical protein
MTEETAGCARFAVGQSITAGAGSGEPINFARTGGALLPFLTMALTNKSVSTNILCCRAQAVFVFMKAAGRQQTGG